MPVPFGMKCNVSRVGEYGPSPAPARICAPAGWGLLVFQTMLTLYGVVAVIGSAHGAKAAWGEKVPPNPPLSFQATTLPLTEMPMSWLNPALAVHRSAFALRIAVPLTLGVNAGRSTPVNFQLVPSLLERLGCEVMAAVTRFVLAAGTSSTVSRVGENGSPLPAPAKMVAVSLRLDFQTSLTTWVVAAARGVTP